MDALQRTERLKSTGAITALDLTYAYDTNSRITSITDGSTPGANAAGKTHSVANLQYDALGHMTHADGWWGTGTFEYDGFGNLGRRWLSETGANPRRIWNFYDANNRLFVTDDSLPTASGGASWHSHSYFYPAGPSPPLSGPPDQIIARATASEAREHHPLRLVCQQSTYDVHDL